MASGLRAGVRSVYPEERLTCLDPRSGGAEIVAGDIANPNGLCFSPDESRLYIVESGSTPRRVRAYDVEDGRRLVNGRIFVDGGEHGAPDGFRCDTDGNLWAGWGTGPTLNGVMVFAPDGEAIGRIALPERCANLCFGGARRATAARVSKLYCPRMG
ncbi:sugar lactone lactonase YvrE [Paraburkholderia sp. MM5482-R2]|uniref:SMP-30/gluconolactonase/LRE family protein n=1 Tax=Paraburkholderia sp. MM5482-R2 TaxID=2991064 RepID=UPI003D222C3E